MPSLFVFLLFMGVFLYLISQGFYIVQQQEALVVERLGKFHRIIYSGLNFLIPLVDKPRRTLWTRAGIPVNVERIDLREAVLDIPEQKVITKDNVGVMVDAIIYVQIIDVKRAIYEIQSLPVAVAQLTQTTLRSLFGEMDLDQTLSNRDLINTRLKLVLDEASEKWGLKLNRVELRNVTPPPDVQLAMEKQMQAERERRANVLAAEGFKQSQILNAEGEKRSRIERSEGEKQEKINQALGDQEATVARALGQAQAIASIAQAQAKSIEMVHQSFQDTQMTASYLVAMEYLKRFGDMTQKNTDKVFIPYEAMGVLSSLGSISELLSKAKAPESK